MYVVVRFNNDDNKSNDRDNQLAGAFQAQMAPRDLSYS